MSNRFIMVKQGDARNARLQDIIVSDEYTNPKIYTVPTVPAHAGNIFLNWASTTKSASLDTTLILDSFPHGFKYIPSVFGTFKFDNGTTQREGTLPFQFGSLAIITLDADATNINLKYYSLDAGIPATTIPQFNMQIRYYVMVEPGK